MANNQPWPNEYADLDAYGQEAAPKHAWRLRIDNVPDGAYDCEIVEALLETRSGHRVCGVTLKMGSMEIEYTYWLNKQEGINAFLAEMGALGFPTANYGSRPGQTPLSQAIPQLVSRLKGIKFRGTKSSRKGKAETPIPGRERKEPPTYHDLRIMARIAGNPMPGQAPAHMVIPPAPNQFQPGGQPNPGTSPGGLRDSDIPF